MARSDCMTLAKTFCGVAAQNKTTIPQRGVVATKVFAKFCVCEASAFIKFCYNTTHI